MEMVCRPKILLGSLKFSGKYPSWYEAGFKKFYLHGSGGVASLKMK